MKPSKILTHTPQRKWDWSSPQPSPAQTRALVRAFLALDEIPADWDGTRRGVNAVQRVPTPDEVRTILQPWRPARWRAAAFQLWTRRLDEAVWLRTHYGDGSDAQFAEWRDTDRDFDPDCDEEVVLWTVLDDAAVFDFGDEWWRVFDVLPELAGPLQRHARGLPYMDGDRMQALREEQGRRVEGRLSSLAGGEHERLDDADAVLEAEYGKLGERLQAEAVESFLLVADAGAWETDCLRLLYLDGKGNIVRHSAVGVSEAWTTRSSWLWWRFHESCWWPHKHDLLTGERGDPGSELGDKYRARGELGRLLYGLDL